MRKNSFLFFTISFFLTLGLFQNCGYFSTGMGSSHLFSTCNGNVDLMIPAFKESYHDFFIKQSCNNCHSVGGIGSGSFAQEDILNAFVEFDQRGPSKIRSKLSSGHQSYNFNDLESDLEKAEERFQSATESSSCQRSSQQTTAEKSLVFFEDELQFGKKRILTEEINGNRQPSSQFQKKQTLIFSLDDGQFSPSLPGVELSIDVEVFYEPDFFFPENYLVNNLRIKTTQSNIQIRGVTLLLNGDPHLVTTYRGINSSVTPAPDFQELDPGGAAAVFLKSEDEIYDNNDAWSIQIDFIQEL